MPLCAYYIISCVQSNQNAFDTGMQTPIQHYGLHVIALLFAACMLHVSASTIRLSLVVVQASPQG